MKQRENSVGEKKKKNLRQGRVGVARLDRVRESAEARF